MRKIIRDKFRAHMERRRRRERRWSARSVDLSCILYFGGGLLITVVDNGWFLTAWLVSGPLLLLWWDQRRGVAVA